jgi:hypothetical protein
MGSIIPGVSGNLEDEALGVIGLSSHLVFSTSE